MTFSGIMMERILFFPGMIEEAHFEQEKKLLSIELDW